MRRDGHWRSGKTIGAKARYLWIGILVMTDPCDGCAVARPRYREPGARIMKLYVGESGLVSRRDQCAGRVSRRVDGRIWGRIRMARK